MKIFGSTSFDYRKLGVKGLVFAFTYRTIIASVVILAVGGYAIHRISILSQPEVDKKHLNKLLSEVKEVKFDTAAIERIQKLRGSNVDIKPNFSDRDNPFDE